MIKSILFRMYFTISSTIIIPIIWFCFNKPWLCVICLLFLLPHKIKTILPVAKPKHNKCESVECVSNIIGIYFMITLAIGFATTILSWHWFIVAYLLFMFLCIKTKYYFFNPVLFYIMYYDYYKVCLRKGQGGTFLLCSREDAETIEYSIKSGRKFSMSSFSRGLYIC